jgi:cytochrome P450
MLTHAIAYADVCWGMQVGGFVIPEGSNVLMSPYYLGRDPQQWGPDAHLYRPERHLPTDPLAATRR